MKRHHLGLVVGLGIGCLSAAAASAAPFDLGDFIPTKDWSAPQPIHKRGRFKPNQRKQKKGQR